MKPIGACYQYNIRIDILNIIQSLTQLLKSTQNSQSITGKGDFEG